MRTSILSDVIAINRKRHYIPKRPYRFPFARNIRSPHEAHKIRGCIGQISDKRNIVHALLIAAGIRGYFRRASLAHNAIALDLGICCRTALYRLLRRSDSLGTSVRKWGVQATPSLASAP